jgi:negative regulator of flagellin synthesis FlgM
MTGLNGIGTGTSVIGSLNLNSTSSATETAPAAVKASDTAPASTGTVTDQASVSSTGGLVAQALNTSDVRSDKVAALQTAIASGSYQVSSADVASKIVDSLL